MYYCGAHIHIIQVVYFRSVRIKISEKVNKVKQLNHSLLYPDKVDVDFFASFWLVRYRLQLANLYQIGLKYMLSINVFLLHLATGFLVTTDITLKL